MRLVVVVSMLAAMVTGIVGGAAPANASAPALWAALSPTTSPQGLSVVTLSLRTGTPTGTVTIKEGSKVICRIALFDDTGSCRLSPRQLGVGRHTLVASYPGNPMYLPSVATVKLTVVA
jgi:hypothetical protein